MQTRLKPAVRTALAYASVMGRFPSHIHLSTWSAANALTDRVPYWNAALEMELHRLELQPEALAAIADDPLKVACDWLKERGFKVDQSDSNRTAHYIAFRHAGRSLPPEAEGITALAYRNGGGSVTVLHDSRPYRTTWQIGELGDAWPALLRPAMYIGERPNGEHASDYLKRALVAYAS